MRPAIGAVTVVQFRLMRALSSAAFFDSTLALSGRRWRRRRRHPAGNAVIPDQRRVALGLLAIGDHQRLGLFQRRRRFVPVAR